MKKNYSVISQQISLLRFLPVVLFAGVYPAIFHYANNANLVLLSSFLELSIVMIAVSLIVYFIFYLIYHRNAFPAIIGSLIFLLFFNLYGPAYEGLKFLDLIQVETYSFFPFYLILTAYFSVGFSKCLRSSPTKVVNSITLILGVLIFFNLVKILPIEINKIRTIENQDNIQVVKPGSQNYPDIYYLIFDEAAGFEAIRQYWRDDSVNEHVDYLQSLGFYIAEESHSGSIYTWREISTRLNFQEFPIPAGIEGFNDLYNKAIVNNQVMNFLKTLGYTIVAFDQRRDAFPTADPLPADYLIEEAPDTLLSSFSWMDEYKMLVFRNTLLRPIIHNLTPYMARHKDMIFYTIENVASLKVSTPKMVYVHLLFPHAPFMFTEKGDIIMGRTDHYNWQRYHDTYKFFLTASRIMIENILTSSSADYSPVIILQSDHGVRNLESIHYSGYLENYPEEYKTLIMNAMYLPGCEDAPLTQDVNPINTFPIVFNCYFDADIPLQ